MANKKSKIDPGVAILVITCTLFFLFFLPVIGDMFLIALLGGGGLVAGTAGLQATTEFISVLRDWSD